MQLLFPAHRWSSLPPPDLHELPYASIEPCEEQPISITTVSNFVGFAGFIREFRRRTAAIYVFHGCPGQRRLG